MPHYLRTTPEGVETWCITDQKAFLTGVSNPERGPYYYEAQPNETIWDCLRRSTPWFDDPAAPPFAQLELEPNHHYPRMARDYPDVSPDTMWSPSWSDDFEQVVSAGAQIEVLTRDLEAICRTVQPTGSTLSVHGHNIRNLLILASTEAEMHFKGILKAHGVLKKTFRTADYVRLLGPMRLDVYAVELADFPSLKAIRPFEGWQSSEPTASLPWYAAYNAVKHDRETSFSRGTLEAAIAALSACVVLQRAQFGSVAMDNAPTARRMFRFARWPSWPRHQRYISFESFHWHPVVHPDFVPQA